MTVWRKPTATARASVPSSNGATARTTTTARARKRADGTPMTEAGPAHRPFTDDSARRLRSSRPNPTMPRDIYVLSLVAVIVALGFGIVGPAIPLLAADFGVGKTAAATAVSAFALCRLASALANGVLVERLGA